VGLPWKTRWTSEMVQLNDRIHGTKGIS
jgi:hypothetical protein